MFHILQVRGVCAEVVLKRLLVADVNEYAVENAELRRFAARDKQSALQHILYQAHGFETHRLAAGIGTRDNQYALVTIEGQAEGHHLLALRFMVEIEQRVACLEPSYHRTLVKHRHYSVDRKCKARFGTDKVDACKEPVGIDNLLQLRTYVVGKGRKYFLYLVSLGELQFAQVVVKFHHLRGLEKCRLSCSRLVLDNTFNLTPVGVEHRYHETPVTNGHLGILRRPAFALGTAQRAAYLRVHFIAFARHLPPDVLQRRRCIVEYLSFVVNYFSKPAQYIGIKLDALCKGKKRWILDTAVGQQET